MTFDTVLTVSVNLGLGTALVLVSIWAWKLSKTERLPAGLKEFVQMAAIVLGLIGCAQVGYQLYEVGQAVIAA